MVGRRLRVDGLDLGRRLRVRGQVDQHVGGHDLELAGLLAHGDDFGVQRHVVAAAVLALDADLEEMQAVRGGGLGVDEQRRCARRRGESVSLSFSSTAA